LSKINQSLSDEASKGSDGSFNYNC
jgi:hypothetical protein